MTKRQQEALTWLETVGKANSKLLRAHGFQTRTFDALADAGLIQREYMPRTIGGPFPVYRPLRDHKFSCDVTLYPGRGVCNCGAASRRPGGPERQPV